MQIIIADTFPLPDDLADLTPNAVSGATNWRSWERGVELLEISRPTTRVVGQTIAASVHGSRGDTYQVQIFLQPYKTVPRGYFAATCTCPMGKAKSWCKHAVAAALAHLRWTPPPPPPPEPWWRGEVVTINDLVRELPHQAATISGWAYIENPVDGGAALLTAAVTAGDMEPTRAVSAACRLAWPRDADHSHGNLENVGYSLAKAVASVTRAARATHQGWTLIDLAAALYGAALWLAEHADDSYGGVTSTLRDAVDALLDAARDAPPGAEERLAETAEEMCSDTNWGLGHLVDDLLARHGALAGLSESVRGALTSTG